MTIPYRPKPSGSPVIFAGGQVNNFYLFVPLDMSLVLFIPSGGEHISTLYWSNSGQINLIMHIIVVAGVLSVACPCFVLVAHQGQRTDGYWSTLCVTLPHPLKCRSLLAGIRCPRAARHSTAWCKWRALCKWSNIFATSVLGSHATFLFHPSDSYFCNHHCLIHHPFNISNNFTYLKF